MILEEGCFFKAKAFVKGALKNLEISNIPLTKDTEKGRTAFEAIQFNEPIETKNK